MNLIPIVAIIGRPNVGKSTLFNRLIGKRKALTCNYAGFSRDRNYAICSWEGKEFSIIDTGGWKIDPKEQMWHLIHNQIELAIKEADLILFVVDGKKGLHPKDKDFLNLIRKCGKKNLLIVNKIDSPKEELNIYQFYELNKELIAISSLHGLNINALLDRISSSLPTLPSLSLGESKEIKIAIVGKPNVGKSSLVNALLGKERVIVHAAPGTTRDAIDTVFKEKGDTFRLIDTAGIRRRKKTKEIFEILSVISAQKSIQRADICLLILEPFSFSEQDIKIADMIEEGKCGCIIVVNKSDLIKNEMLNKNMISQKIREKLYFLDYAPILFISAKTKKGIGKILATIRIVKDEYNRTIAKNEVQKLILSACSHHPPPIKKGKRTKIYNAQQIKTAPPLFCLWLKGSLPVSSYKRYLKNKIREKFHFTGTPLGLVFKKTTPHL